MRLSSVPVASALLLVVIFDPACSAPPIARAKRVESRAELIGGPRALGEVGDWLLENGKARFIIQDAGFSRGFGVFGGALLDADLVRAHSGRGDSSGGVGRDNFGEMFPAFFLEALEPRDLDDPNNPSTKLPAIEVVADGHDGGPAELVVRGLGGDFLAMTQRANETLLGDPRATPTLFFETHYILQPEANYLEITTRVQNIAAPAAALPLPAASFGGAEIPTPFGDVVLFGAGNKVFAPHQAGFDIRFTLEDIYAAGGIDLPALPGIVAEFMASASKDVSYGMMMGVPAAPVENYAFKNRDAFPDATEHSLHVPFIASAFTAIFQVVPPSELAANDGEPGGADEMSYTRYFIVGDGDVASISDTVYRLLGDATGTLSGVLRDEASGAGIEGAHVFVVDGSGKKVTEIGTDIGGRFQAQLRPGNYRLIPQAPGRALPEAATVDVTAQNTTRAELRLPPVAEIVVTTVEPGTGPVPAKVTVVGTVPAEHARQDPRRWLFDQSLGEEWRFEDLIPDDDSDPETMRYIEAFAYSKDGVARVAVRPGRYQVFVGRGLEYDRFEAEVELVAGRTTSVTARVSRVVNTAGYVGADFHLHSQYSLDSGALLEDRILSYAGEGLEYAVSTDHNFLVDYQPVIQKLGLERFINSCIGLELTTIDRGHFNGFPLELGSGALVEGNNEAGFRLTSNIASRTYGSFEWALRDPGDIFADLRSLGRKLPDGSIADVIVQVNHPRDSILGYFEQYEVNADTLEVEGQSGLIFGPVPEQHPEFAAEAFSWDFDAVEVFNGKRIELLKSYRVPTDAPTVQLTGGEVHIDPVSCCPVTPGEVLRDRDQIDCDDDIPGDCTCDAVKAQAQVDSGQCDERSPIAFPGVFDDWVKMLEAGQVTVGTANSDSHDPDKEEPGSPRTYIGVPSDQPASVTEDHVRAAFARGDVLMTNGPFLRVRVGDVGMGGVAVGPQVHLDIHLEQPAWVGADHVRVYRNSEMVHEEEVDGTAVDISVDVDFTADGFILVEAEGAASMFPSLYPNALPPLSFSDAIGAIGDSFGLGTVAGALQPSTVFVTTPYALTNPIWVDVDGDGAIAPSRTLGEARAPATMPRVRTTRPVAWVPTEAEAQAEEERSRFAQLPIKKQIAFARLPRWMWPTNDPRDIRRVLVQFLPHAH